MSDSKLVRGIGRWDLTAIAINTIIGAGIFGLPSKVQALIGSWSLLAFLACAVIIGFIVICYAEVSSRFTSTGGPYLYAKEAFGPVVGFEVGWLYWIVRITSFAANCNLLITYLGFFWHASTEPTARLILVIIVIGLLTIVNLIGVRESALMTNIFTIGKLIPLALFGLVGLFFIEPANFTFSPVPDYTSFSAAVLLLLYAFLGFETAVIPAGETKDPQRNVPFAIIFALLTVAVVYILVQIVSIGTLPGLASSEKPLADAASNFMGPFAAAFIAAGAIISISGNLNVSLLGSSRLTYAMGDQRELPAFLGRTHSRFKTPHISILLNAVILVILTWQSSFLSALTIATITRLLVYATTCLSLPVFRRRSDVPEAKFLAPAGLVAAFLSLALTAWLLTNVDFRKEGLPIIVAAGIGLAIFLAYRFFGKPQIPDAS